MPTKLATTVKKIHLVRNGKNSDLINKFYEFMRSNGVSERHQNNNLKAVINFANFLGDKVGFTDINKTEPSKNLALLLKLFPKSKKILVSLSSRRILFPPISFTPP